MLWPQKCLKRSLNEKQILQSNHFISTCLAVIAAGHIALLTEFHKEFAEMSHGTLLFYLLLW